MICCFHPEDGPNAETRPLFSEGESKTGRRTPVGSESVLSEKGNCSGRTGYVSTHEHSPAHVETPLSSSTPRSIVGFEDHEEEERDDTSSESEYSRQSSYSPIHEPSPAAAVLLHDTSPAAAVLLHEPSPAAGVLLHDTSPSISRVVLTDDEATGKQKLKDQEKKERNHAHKISQAMFQNLVMSSTALPDLGSRLHKYWYRAEAKEGGLTSDMLQFTAKLSKKCLSLKDGRTMDALNGLFQSLRHSYLHRVHGVVSKDEHVSVLQDFMPGGSLKDIIFEAEPAKDWFDKYHRGTPLKLIQVATCGRHILEAVLALYKVGFPAIGQIHSGNIFMVENRYVLGGYENTLLGYESNLYGKIASGNLLASIDVIMFGHLIYEMATGGSPDELLPSEQSIQQKVGDKDLKDVLNFIFSLKWSMIQILKQRFFQNSLIDVVKTKPLEITPEAVQLLTRICHGALDTQQPIHSDLDVLKLTKDCVKDYVDRRPLVKLGWRSGKVWAKAQRAQGGDGLLSAVAIPHTCPIIVSCKMKGMRELLGKLNHPNIHKVNEIHCVLEEDEHVIVTVQHFLKEGSLKDLIHKCSPLERWEDKYQNPLPLEKECIARYGRHVLDAIIFLYDVGFPPLGHVQTGNIFLVGDVCQLGGYENTLLGYRTQHNLKFREFQESIDVVMFGHVIFEMSTGRELETAIPTEADYKNVSKDVEAVLRFIFLQRSVADIMKNEFFQQWGDLPTCNVSLSKDARRLLKKVRKGKQREQSNRPGVMKHAVSKLLPAIKSGTL